MQTTYSTTRPLGVAGMEIDTEPALKKHAVNEESVAIPFGVFVARGASSGYAKLPDIATDARAILGVVLSTYWQDNRSLDNADGVKAGDPMNVIEEGGVWVLCEQDVTTADLGMDAFVRITSDGSTNTQLGKVRKDVDSGRAVHVRGATFDSTGAAGTPVKLRLRATLGGTDAVSPMVFAHAQAAADTTVPLFKNRTDRHMRITAIDYYNATGLAEDATNFFELVVRDAAGTKVYGSWSTETDEEGTIAAATYVSLTLGANLVVAPGEEVVLLLDETETATLPAGSVTIHAEYI